MLVSLKAHLYFFGNHKTHVVEQSSGQLRYEHLDSHCTSPGRAIISPLEWYKTKETCNLSR